MQKLILTPVLAAGFLGLSAIPAHAVFITVDDMESYNVGDKFDTTVNNSDTPSSVLGDWTANAGDRGKGVIVEDDNVTGNKYLGFNKTVFAPFYARNDSSALTIDAASTAATVFVRFVYEGAKDNTSFSLGMTDNAAATGSADYSLQALLVPNAPPASANWQVFNGATQTDTGVAATYDTDLEDAGQADEILWTNLWFVINNAGNTYDVYLTTGDNGATSADRIADDFTFKNATTGDLTHFLLSGGNKSPDDGGIDFLAIDTSGENLAFAPAVPEPASLALMGLAGLLLVGRGRRA